MIAAGLRLRDRHRAAYPLALAILGALLALLAVEALAALANLLGFMALHDVGVNTGPIAAIGGAGAGAGAGGGRSTDPADYPDPPGKLTWDPVAKHWDYGPPMQGPPRGLGPPRDLTWDRWVNIYIIQSVDWLAGTGVTYTKASALGKA